MLYLQKGKNDHVLKIIYGVNYEKARRNFKPNKEVSDEKDSSLSLSLIMVLSVTDAEAQYMCPPGWTQGDPITHLIDVNGTPTVITIYWCFRPSQNGSPYSDIYIGEWVISPAPEGDIGLTSDDLVKLIVAHEYSDLGFTGNWAIPPCPNKTPDFFQVFNGGCYASFMSYEVMPPATVFRPCYSTSPPVTCFKSYRFCFQFAPAGHTELVMEVSGQGAQFECDPDQNQYGQMSPCAPFCDYSF